MEYPDYSAYPQADDAVAAAASIDQATNGVPDPEYRQQEKYGYGGEYSEDPNAHHDYSGYGYDAEQQQVDGVGVGDGGYYDPETGAYYYGNSSAVDDEAREEQLAELTVEGDSGYNGNNYEYGGYEWDEATGQYTQAPSAFGDDDGAENAPPSPFRDEAYWEQELYNQTPEETNDAALDDLDISREDSESTPGTPATSIDSMETPVSERTSRGTPKSSSTLSKVSTPSSKKKKPKSKKERMQIRQELLEKEEEEKLLQKQTDENSPDGQDSSGAAKVNSTNPAAAPSQKKKLTFIEREKAKMHLQVRKARAIARKRIPFQVRILTQARQHLSPLERYFGSRSVDAALSDIFWASLKGDLRRVRHLVEIERVSPTDCKLDPWNIQQTPLHWAAKGGSREVIEYLLQAGANVHCLDENGSFPLHIACWAGHIDATLALLKAGDSRDLYVQDFDVEDSRWLPKFIEDLIRGIIRYKIKGFKPPFKPAKGKEEPAKTPEGVAGGGAPAPLSTAS